MTESSEPADTPKAAKGAKAKAAKSQAPKSEASKSEAGTSEAATSGASTSGATKSEASEPKPTKPKPTKPKTTKPRTWQTKYGPRRVREALPTLEEALFAARGLSDDFNEQVEIAASLLGVSVDQARTEAMKTKHTTTLQVRAPTNADRSGVTRSVVVERKVVRRQVVVPRRIGV